MITLPVVLIAAAVLLLLALLLGLFLQRRRTAGPRLPGPRTVADLVQQRADRDPAPAPADPVEPSVVQPAPADAMASTVDVPGAAVGADPDPVDVEEPRVPVSGPTPVTAVRAIAPLGDDVPWRRAAQMSGTADADADVDADPDPAPEPEPAPSEVGRVPALALLRRPLPADTRHPFLSSAPRLAVVPTALAADVADVADAVPAEAVDAEPVESEPVETESVKTERTETGAESTGAESTGAESTGAESTGAESTGAESTGAESTGVESTRAERTSVGSTGVEPGDGDAASAGQVGAEPAAEPTDAESGHADPTGGAAVEDAQSQVEHPGSELSPVGGGIAAGVTGARAVVGWADDHDAEPEVAHASEMDLRVVEHRADHSHVDLVAVDDGPPDADGSSGAPVSADSDQDAPLAPMTDTVEPRIADRPENVDQPAEAHVAPDHSAVEPVATPVAVMAGPAVFAGAAAFAWTRDTAHMEPDGFPSTDPDVLFDSPSETTAAAPPAPAPDAIAAGAPAAGAPAAEAPRTSAAETPAPETPAPETPAPETPAPETPAPETPAPETPAPETPAPETPAPETPAPETPAPETPAPETPAPETPAPETPTPETPTPASTPPVPAPEVSAATAALFGSVAAGARTPAPDAPAAETTAPEGGAVAAPGSRLAEAGIGPAPGAQAGPPAPTPTAPATEQPGTTESRRSPRDPAHLAAEQAAADLALLRTFGDPSARPERAPIVALEGTTRPESPRPVGAAQPVRFRAVRRDGTEVSGAAVALLDDRGHEVGAGRSAAGELTAPHPGAYVLVATAPDHQPGAVALAVGDAPVDADVLLVRSAALVGVVIGEDGPLAGARVTLVQDGEVVDVAETDADGAYLVADLASGEYAVSVAAAGCDADVVLVVLADETECVHDVELEPAGVSAG